MMHEQIDARSAPALRPAPARPARMRRQLRALPPVPRRHRDAVGRFADVCAALGGITMLHDLMPDLVTVSFGSRTRLVSDRLRSRGWTFVGTGEWSGEPVLGVSFKGDRRAGRTIEELADALVAVVGELEIAETRLW